MRHRLRRAVGAVTVVLVVAAVGTSAFFTAPGTARGGAVVGTLPPATDVAATLVGPTVRSVDVSWSASGPPGGEPVDGFYVERLTGAATAPACGTTPAAPLPAGTASCRDAAVPSGEHAYRVTRVYRSWTASSAPSAPVNVPASVATALLLQSPPTATAGEPIDLGVTVVDQYGDPFGAWSGARCLELGGPSSSPAGTAPGYPPAAGCATGGSVTFGAGAATVAVTLVAAETTAITVTDVASGIAATTTPVVVAPAAPGALQFVQPPSTVTAGAPITPPVTVQVTDAFGNAVPVAGRPVTTAVASGPGAFTPGSTTNAVTDADGLATFADLALGTEGTYQLQMTSGGLTATSAAFVVSPQPPTVTAATPASRGQGAPNQAITISGTFFRAGATASFGAGVTVNSTTFVSPTQLTANVSVGAAAATGLRDVTVTNPPGYGTATCAGCFTVTAGPGAALGVSPGSRGRGATNQTVTVTGSGFVSGATVAFAGTGITVGPTTFVSPTQLTLTISVAADAPLGARDVTVTNPDGGTRTAAGAFTVAPAPIPTAAAPTTRGQGAAGQTIIITGSGFVSGAAPTFSGTGITVNSTTFVSATQLSVNLTVAAGAALGARNVTVTNPDAGVGVCAACFSVTAAPTVTAIDPGFGLPGTTYPTVTVTGTGFVSGATATFSGTGVTVGTVTVQSSTQLTLSLTVASGAALGTRSLTVTNPDAGAGACAGCYTVSSGPTVTATAPASRGQGATDQIVTITGTLFRPGATATFSGTGITVNSTTYVSPTQLTAAITVAITATTGARNVTVTNPTGFGTATCTSCFTVTAAPGTTSAITLSPTSRGQGAANRTVTVNGSNFQAGATVAFSGTGITVNSTTFVSATQLTLNITLAPTATVSARNVTVTNPDAGTRTVTGAFTVNAGPTVTSISPTPRGQGFTGNVTLTGTNFATGVTVGFVGGGVTINSATRNSASQLTLNITVPPTAALGGHDLRVTNPDAGSTTCTGCLTVTAAPVITALDPPTRSAVTIGSHTVTGTGFQPGATIAVSGLLVSVTSITFVSPTQLTATIQAVLGVVTGPRNLTITNPDGGTSTCTGCLTITLG